jgi:hypothetical protein
MNVKRGGKRSVPRMGHGFGSYAASVPDEWPLEDLPRRPLRAANLWVATLQNGAEFFRKNHEKGTARRKSTLDLRH